MTKTLWVKLSVDYFMDPKIVTVGPQAELMFIRGLAYAKKNNNPVIPKQMLTLIGLGMNTDFKELAYRLVESGLWQDTDDGYQITAWDAWQVNETNKGQSAGGTLAMHNRWHKTNRSSTCTHCQDAATDDRLAVLATEAPKPKPEKAWPQEAINLCENLAGWIQTNGGKRPKVTDEWLAEMEKLHRIDGHDWNDIGQVMKWSQQDSFWQTNILSPGKLRKQFTQLQLKMKAPVKGGATPDGERAWADVQEQVRKVGSYGAPTFATARTRNAVRAIGWRTICQSTQLEVMRGQFMRAYTEATDAE